MLADGGIRMPGLVTIAEVRMAITDANGRGIPVVVNGAVDAALAAPVVDEVRRTATTVEIEATDPRPWPHRWSSVQFAADQGLVAELVDVLARDAPVRQRRGLGPYRLAMRRGHVPALVALRAAGARTPRGTAPPKALPTAVVLRPYLPQWTRWIIVATAVTGLIGFFATRHWAFLIVGVTGGVMVGIGNAAAGAARIAVDGPRLAVHPFARWHGPIDLREVTALDYRPAPSSRMTARWRLVASGHPVPDIVTGYDFMTPGFERHLAAWLDPAGTQISATATARLRASAGDGRT